MTSSVGELRTRVLNWVLNWGGVPLLFLTLLYLPQLWRDSGTHLLLSEQRKILINLMHKLCFEPGTFSTGGECSNHSATVPLHLFNTVAKCPGLNNKKTKEKHWPLLWIKLIKWIIYRTRGTLLRWQWRGQVALSCPVLSSIVSEPKMKLSSSGPQAYSCLRSERHKRQRQLS